MDECKITDDFNVRFENVGSIETRQIMEEFNKQICQTKKKACRLNDHFSHRVTVLLIVGMNFKAQLTIKKYESLKLCAVFHCIFVFLYNCLMGYTSLVT